jgi:hypothetical protein
MIHADLSVAVLDIAVKHMSKDVGFIDVRRNCRRSGLGRCAGGQQQEEADRGKPPNHQKPK